MDWIDELDQSFALEKEIQKLSDEFLINQFKQNYEDNNHRDNKKQDSNPTSERNNPSPSGTAKNDYNTPDRPNIRFY